jgi:hypothetical protein
MDGGHPDIQLRPVLENRNRGKGRTENSLYNLRIGKYNAAYWNGYGKYCMITGYQ